jgi:carbonic anhydrase
MLVRPPAHPMHPRPGLLTALACALALWVGAAQANDPAPPPKATNKAPVADITASTASNPKDIAQQLREALGTSVVPKKNLTITVSGKATKGRGTPAAANSKTARAVTPMGHGEDVHWTYDGDTGPQAWGRLKPDFNLCATGKRQSPINIEEDRTLQGPAEPLLFNYAPSVGTVVNNGHTILVEAQGDNSITVRGGRYRLVQFHFHAPAEEQINGRRAAMVAHLVHRNDEGQLAVVAVLLEPGNASPLIDKVWTYMPLEINDRVRMPAGMLNLNELLPLDQRYYQFIGSLTTPPCSEGVLWMVLKSPMQISPAQLKLFTQLYPMNARPVQAVNGRPVRDAQ